ncbi:MAG: sigma-70 family RNA polymerase sigma factor [Bacteroidetes bacterium]|nr:MAG: sigma-70 family RNA polymerase sigma factor [Bacteroidota bacterium]
MDERVLVKECLKGSSIAQKELFDKFAPKMMFVCLRYMGEQTEAEDVLQEAFIKVFRSLPKYQFEGSFEGWIRRIVVNSCLDAIRKNKQFMNDHSLESVEYKLSTSEGAIDQLYAEDLLKLIKQMPPGYQAVFNLFAIEGYSHKEIAELLGISEETSKSQYYRARAYMKNCLEKLTFER